MVNTIQIDYDELARTCATFREIHNDTIDRKLPEFNEFTQDDIQYCLDHGWSHYIQLAIHLNPALINPNPEQTQVSRVVNGRAPKDKAGFHYYYERLSPAQELFFTSRLKLTWSQVQQIYKERFEPEPNHLGVRVHRTVKSLADEYGIAESTLSRYIAREHLRRISVMAANKHTEQHSAKE